MFDFLFAADYSSRVVGRDDFDWGFVSTASVTDGDHPYETAVSSRLYEDEDGETDSMIIVEAYDSHEDAEAGHAKWVEIMTSESPPNELIDCENAAIGQLLGAFGEIKQTRVLPN